MSTNSDLELYTRYTITLKDLLDKYPNFLTECFVGWDETTLNSFINVFTSMYWNYEIEGETINEFKLMLTNKFNEKKDYYYELITAYKDKINYLDGAKVESLVENIDLPNKQTSKEYVSTKTRTSATGGINVIELKRQYLDLIRNYNEDFAKDFKSCFTIIYW